MIYINDFNPRSPCGERPEFPREPTNYPHFNPRSPCGERHDDYFANFDTEFISIHAPRVGSDYAATVSGV